MKVPEVKLRAGVREAKAVVGLVTPLFGGSAVARRVDRESWLRPASVRGALRFWWRAVYGHTFRDCKSMRDAEDVIFGSAASDGRHGPGAVVVRVDCCTTAGEEIDPPGPGTALNLAYFPASDLGQESVKLFNPSDAGVGATVTISSQHPGLTGAQWDEVLTAFSAFCVFGGAGARTRRAAGALVWREGRGLQPPTTRSAFKSWWAGLAKVAQQTPDWFSLAGAMVYLGSKVHKRGQDAQAELLEMWREFRQDRPHPTSWRGPNGWGRSRWSEADAVRLLSGMFARWEDGTTHAPPKGTTRTAPRAHLGLPITLKFKDDSKGARHSVRGKLIQSDPAKVEIVLRQDPTRVERYASPVMLCVAALDGGYTPLVLVSESRIRGTVVVKDHGDWTLSLGPWSAARSKLTAALQKAQFALVDSAS
ncbi:MAG: hypothetical protein AMXMBFR64_50340 [Myxococcales bacterium]